jgi:hypothetical protein
VTAVISSLSGVGHLIGPGLVGFGVVAAVILVAFMVAAIRCDKADIPKVIEAFGSWWPWHRRR